MNTSRNEVKDDMLADDYFIVVLSYLASKHPEYTLLYPDLLLGENFHKKWFDFFIERFSQNPESLVFLNLEKSKLRPHANWINGNVFKRDQQKWPSVPDFGYVNRMLDCALPVFRGMDPGIGVAMIEAIRENDPEFGVKSKDRRIPD